MLDLPDIKTASLQGKTVFLRADLDAPVEEKNGIKVVVDDTRLVLGMQTVEYLLSQGVHLVIAGHLRRPEGFDASLSLLPIATWFCQALHALGYMAGITEKKFGEFDGWELSTNISLLENLRFYKEEKDNDKAFAQKLASLADIYVNDAFASSHRKHASIVGVPEFLPHYAGFHVQDEISVLSEIMEEPKRPFIVIIGGAKIETKLPLVTKMHGLADAILVGGKIATEAKNLLQGEHDHVSGHKAELVIAQVNEAGIDITLLSVQTFLQLIKSAKTIVWNGPVGYIEDPKGEGAKGSEMLAKGILESSAYSVVGGGDTLEFLRSQNMLDKFSFFSTGGGAMLAFLSGEKLPGIEALLKPQTGL